MKQKFKIMRTPTQITDEEIRSFMDFDALLQLREKTVQQQKSLRKIKNTLGGVVGLLIIPAIYFLLPGELASPSQQSVTPGSRIAPEVSRNEVPSDSSKNDSDKKGPVSSSPPQKEKATAAKGRDNAEGSETEKDPKSEKVVPVYVQAEPGQGYPLLYEYFEQNLVYPGHAVEDSIAGTLNVVFIIDSTGDATDISVENSLGPSFDKEAIRLVDNMPLWRPATYNGIPVKSKISLPITFSVQKIRND